MVIFHSYVKLPEGISKISGARIGDDTSGNPLEAIHEASSGKGVPCDGRGIQKKNDDGKTYQRWVYDRYIL